MSYSKLPPIGTLEAFFVVAERSSLKAAAPDLNISVSALSRRIQTLESHLGVPLFERGARALRLTREGAALRETVSASFEMLRAGVAALGRDPLRERLRLGAPAGLTGYWLAPRLADFRATHPGVEVVVETSDLAIGRLGSSLDALVLLLDGGWAPPADRYQVEPLARVMAQAVCSPALQARLGDPVAELSGQVLLTPDAHPDWLGRWLRAISAAAGPKRVETFDSAAVMLEAAAAGLGIALVDDRLAEGQLAAGRLVDPFGVKAPTSAAYVLAARTADSAWPALQRFRAWLLQQFAPADTGGAFLQALSA